MPIGTGHQKGGGTSMALGIDLRRKRPKSGDIMGISKGNPRNAKASQEMRPYEALLRDHGG